MLFAAPYVSAQQPAESETDRSHAATSNALPIVEKVAKEEKTIKENVPPALIPVFTNYKGVTIGMSAHEVRQTLDHLKEKGKHQDFFVFSDSESAQVFYDAKGLVRAISVDYLAKGSAAPDVMAVLGQDVPAKANGSIHKLVRYPAVNYWVSYNRTAGDSPIITITMQKMHKTRQKVR